MTIRTYHPSDRQSVLKLLSLNTPQYFAPEEKQDLEDFLENHIDRYYVAETGGTIVSCGGFNITPDGKTARISWDIVHPESQGKGIGSLLTEFRIAEISKIKSVQNISVRTSQLVYRFYEKFGFELQEVARDFWAQGFDMYRLERKVKLED